MIAVAVDFEKQVIEIRPLFVVGIQLVLLEFLEEAAIRGVVFADQELLRQINELLHSKLIHGFMRIRSVFDA